MSMPPYAVLCYTPGCGRPAAYKVAAAWSDGVTRELKTYGLTCADCLATWFRRACERRATCRLATSESLDRPGIYRVHQGRCDQRLDRLTDLESQLTTPSDDGVMRCARQA